MMEIARGSRRSVDRGGSVAAAVGALVAVLTWTVVLSPAGYPFLDDHLGYAAVLVLLALTQAGATLGLGRPRVAGEIVLRTGRLR